MTKTHSRPRVSNDNPCSEAQFKTLKYRPEFPEQFGSIEDARAFCQRFFGWYNAEHYHSGIGWHHPIGVHYGRAEIVQAARADVLTAAYARNPERFVRKHPEPQALPTAVWINKPSDTEQEPVHTKLPRTTRLNDLDTYRALVPDLTAHLARYTEPGEDALVFTSPKGTTLRRSNFQPHWRAATESAGVPDLHFHDLRHTGNTWAAETGATLHDLMDRMGHSTTRAALIYLHRRPGRDKAIAAALDDMIEQGRAMDTDDEDPGEDGGGVPARKT